MQNTFGIDIIPPNDLQRIAAMQRYRLLNTPNETVFDNITRLTSQIFQTPISLISLVDAEVVFFKSTVGVGNLRCADRGESLCALAILSPTVMVFENTLSDPIVANSVPVNQGVRFYAGAPLITSDGFLIGTVCIADNSTRQFNEADKNILESMAKVVMEQIELRLAALTEIEKQTQLMEKKDEFISVASHELKTPVTSLMASLQLLDRMKHHPKPEVLVPLITQSNKSLNKLSRLINELLNVNRIATGQLQLQKTKFKINDIVTDAANEVSTATDHQFHIDGDPDLTVCADSQKVEQVVINLLMNAVKYAPVSKNIWIESNNVDKFVRVSVRDEGPGIAAHRLPYLFERYYRADYNELNFSGLGLGLYICSEIVKKHGGEIGVDSTPGRGSTFWFTLPNGAV